MRLNIFYQFILAGLLGLLSHNPCEAAHKDWRATTIWDADFKLERVIVGDVDSANKGNEVLVLSGDGRVVVISKSPNGWNSKVIWKHSGELVGAAVGDLDMSHKGNEVFVGGEGGTVEMIYPDDLRHSTVFDKGVSIHCR